MVRPRCVGHRARHWTFDHRQRVGAVHPDKRIVSLDPMVCPCSTMFRIDSAHLVGVLEGLVEGRVAESHHGGIETAEWARVARDRMLAIT